jgi:hypothetical protein
MSGHLGPPDDVPHRLDMGAVRPSELLFERSVAMPLDELGLLSVRQTDLLLLQARRRCVVGGTSDLRLCDAQQGEKRRTGVR